MEQDTVATSEEGIGAEAVSETIEGKTPIQETTPKIKDPVVVATEGPVPATLPEAIVNKNESSISAFRTYRGDIARVVEKEKLTAADLALAEEKRRFAVAQKKIPQPPVIKSTYEPPKIKQILPIIGILVAILAVLGLIYYAYSYISSIEQEKVEARIPHSLIFADDYKEITISSGIDATSLVNMLTQEVNSDIPINTLRYYYFTTGSTTVPAQAFIRFISPRVSLSLLRTLKAPFMYGIYSYDGNQAFLLLDNDAYDSARAGMGEWESRIPAELSRIITGKDAPSEGTYTWQDSMLKNVPVRILKLNTGENILYYGFINRKLILIAGGESVFSEAISRYNTPRPATIDIQ